MMPCKQGGYRYRIEYQDAGKRVRKHYQTRAQASLALAAIAAELSRRPSDADPLTSSEWTAVTAARAAGIPLTDAVSAAIAHAARLATTTTLSNLIAHRIAELYSGNRSARYKSHSSQFFQRVTNWFGPETNLSLITTPTVHAFLHGQRWSHTSIANYQSILSTLFARGIALGLCTTNPVAALTKPSTIPDRVHILTPAEILHLLHHTPPDILPAICIATFAGLRPESEIQRLHWDQVHIDRGFIEILARRSKSAARRLVTIQPALRHWLHHACGGNIPTTGPVWPVPATGRRRWRQARTDAGYGPTNPWHQDALRHSFASYHLAAWADAAATAAQLGHSTTQMLYQHYREIVTPTDAAQFWALRPWHLVPVHGPGA